MAGELQTHETRNRKRLLTLRNVKLVASAPELARSPSFCMPGSFSVFMEDVSPLH
jgi:hypothetical protein